jgi:hypothetical protein
MSPRRSKGASEVIETCGIAGVTIWDETDGLLLSYDRLVEIGNVTQPLKPTKEGVPEVIETSGLVRVILGYNSISNT